MYPGGLRNNAAGKGLDQLRAIRAAVKIPIVAIGGITEARVAESSRPAPTPRDHHQRRQRAGHRRQSPLDPGHRSQLIPYHLLFVFVCSLCHPERAEGPGSSQRRKMHPNHSSSDVFGARSLVGGDAATLRKIRGPRLRSG